MLQRHSYAGIPLANCLAIFLEQIATIFSNFNFFAPQTAEVYLSSANWSLSGVTQTKRCLGVYNEIRLSAVECDAVPLPAPRSARARLLIARYVPAWHQIRSAHAPSPAQNHSLHLSTEAS